MTSNTSGSCWRGGQGGGGACRSAASLLWASVSASVKGSSESGPSNRGGFWARVPPGHSTVPPPILYLWAGPEPPAGASTDSISVRRGAEQDSRAPWEDAGWRPDTAASPLHREPSLQLGCVPILRAGPSRGLCWAEGASDPGCRPVPAPSQALGSLTCGPEAPEGSCPGPRRARRPRERGRSWDSVLCVTHQLLTGRLL